MEAVFWISLSVLFYAFVGYGLLLTLLRLLFKKETVATKASLQPVTVIVPAYNEEAFIEEKIRNCFSLTYPKNLLTFIFITDGSTDNTTLLVNNYSGIRHLFQPERKGKAAAINRAMKQVTTPFVVFTDANTWLHPDSIQNIIRHFQHEKIGGVCGEKRVLSTDKAAVSTGERIYWLYESMLKKADAFFYTVVGAAGELFSVRTALFDPLDENVILDDFVLSASICQKGYRFAYEDKAYATETASESIREERKRKVRISAGCFQALFLLKSLLNPFRNARLSFQYFSRRVLRWTVCPLLVPVLFVDNALLVLQQPEVSYTVFFALQNLFYLFALTGWVMSDRKSVPKLLLIPYYFVFMNLSLYKGFYLFITGRQSVLWEKAYRKTIFS